MSKKKKLYEKIKTTPKQITFEELDKFLGWAGFILRSKKGSHRTYSFEKKARLTVPRKTPHLKEVYVKEALRLIEEYTDWTEQFKDNKNG